MPPLHETFAEHDTVSLSAELGGFLYTPSMLINCFVAKKDRYRMHGESIHSILGYSIEFMLKGYILRIDKEIVRKNLEDSRACGCLTPGDFGTVERILSSLVTLDRSSKIEIAAHDRSDRLALYDARRIEAAFQHDLTLLSCEPESFTCHSDELTHLFKYKYVDVKIGTCEPVDTTAELSEDMNNSYVWVFEPQALDELLNWIESGNSFSTTNRRQVLILKNFLVINHNSPECSEGYTIRVWLQLNGQEITGVAQEDGIIDTALRAVENALRDIVDLDRNNVHHRISDTTRHINRAQVSIQLDVPEQLTSRLHAAYHRIKAVDESKDTLLSTIRAYVKVLDTLLKNLQPE